MTLGSCSIDMAFATGVILLTVEEISLRCGRFIHVRVGRQTGRTVFQHSGKLTGGQVYNIATTENLDGYERLLAYSVGQGAKIRYVVMAINMIDEIQDYDVAPQKKANSTLKPAPEPPLAISLQAVKQFLLTNSALYFLATSAIGSIDVLRRVLVRLGFVLPLAISFPRSSTLRIWLIYINAVRSNWIS